MPALEIVEPESLEEAFMLLGGDDPSVRPLGGGTALMLMMKAQLFRPAKLVSLRRIGAMQGFGLAGDGRLRIGAMTTFSELENAEIVATHLPVVTQTMKTLANVRVRNVACVGGNLAHGDPHLDLPPVWSALGAQVDIVGAEGARSIPVEDLFLGYYETVLAQGELIAALHVPLRPDWRFFYAKVTTRAEHDWPALGLCVGLRMDGPVVADASLVLSAAVDRPTRLKGAEAALRGGEVSEATLAKAADSAVAEVHIEGDSRGSAAYKQHLLHVHLRRAVQRVILGSASE